ncbi:hypothetical protein NDU88_005654 [Pleurodeles waltl]|uniref:Uncharacterized protein n=1 Tax=Pleurodeles waltl TaxID=8319 RepID=A0AAV7RLN1_PLEWA|nr:hypothetical protein NDU88_005654 [Pleurodeles waltl]
MVHRTDLDSPAQLRGTTKITLPKPVCVHHSLRDGTTTIGIPGESRKTRGKPPGLPQAGHRLLLWAEAAERNKERLSAPPS